MKKTFTLILTAVLAGSIMLTGCGTTADQSLKESNKAAAAKSELDPDKPVSLTVWHYYTGAQQSSLDKLVSEFNAGDGAEKGIYVEVSSLGSIKDLEQAVTDSIQEAVGSKEMPDMFASYADTAYSAWKAGKIADISQYVSEDELSEYVDGYIDEGRFNNNDELYLFPTAKSTETLLLNKTDWEPFAEATGSTVDELSTEEGIAEVAERYYEWTDSLTPDIADDGKAFYGRDSMANYFVIGMKQMGVDLFDVRDGEVSINADKDKMRRLWECFYVPYVKGYYARYGKFCADDVKTGEIIAYTGSSASSVYFPDKVYDAAGNERAIDYLISEAPIMEGGENIKVQQGAGMAVAKSDSLHEYASVEFLKWLTAKDNNLRFVAGGGYLPVRKDANNIEAFDKLIEEEGLEVDPKTYDCFKSITDSFNDTSFYTTKCFENGYAVRSVLDKDLLNKAKEDREAVCAAVASGASRQEALKPYLTEENFEEWYDNLCAEMEAEAAK